MLVCSRTSFFTLHFCYRFNKASTGMRERARERIELNRICIYDDVIVWIAMNWEDNSKQKRKNSLNSILNTYTKMAKVVKQTITRIFFSYMCNVYVCVCLSIVGHTICMTIIPTLMDKSFLWLCLFFLRKKVKKKWRVERGRERERMREHNRFHFQNGWLAFLLLVLTKLIFQQSCCWESDRCHSNW